MGLKGFLESHVEARTLHACDRLPHLLGQVIGVFVNARKDQEYVHALISTSIVLNEEILSTRNVHHKN